MNTRPTPVALSFLIALVSLLAGCGPFAPEPRPAQPTGEVRPRPAAPARAESAEAPGAADDPQESSEGEGAGDGAADASDDGAGDTPAPPGATGAVVGVVSFKGEPPARRELAVGGTVGCEHDEPVLSETVIVNDGKLANVFVYVSKGIKDWKGPTPDPLLLDQRGCVYQPHVSGAVVGQTVRASNSDPLSHNVHVLAKRNASPNKTQSAGMKPLELVFERDEVPVVFVCDIHPWMKAFVCVQDHPFFAVSGDDGTFRIEDLPVGEYTLTAWHEKYGKQKSGKLSVQDGGETSVSFEFP